MTRRLVPLAASWLAAALAFAPAALHAQTTAKPPPKPAPKAPVAKPSVAAFDATNPQGLMDLLAEAGARVQTSRREDDSVFVAVTSTAAGFSMQFAGCNAQGRACRAVLLDAPQARSAVTLAQVNAFNQTSVMCRIYQDRAGAPHVLYSTLLFPTMSRTDASNQLLAWQGCLADGRDFLRDPAAYLANAA